MNKVTIVKGDKQSLIAAMKLEQESINQRLKALKKEKQKAEVITRYEEQKKRFMPSTVLPVRIDNIVINYILLERFLKKLRKLECSLHVDGNVLVLNYGGTSHHYLHKGRLTLNDISNHYIRIHDVWENIPTAVIEKERAE